MKPKTQKPLATVGASPRLEIHRGGFHAFEAMKYLDVAKLKKAGKARIEIGRVQGGGVEATIVAEICKGMITNLTPIDCKGCSGGARKAARSTRGGSAATKKALRAALERVRQLGYPGVKLPIPVPTARPLEIVIGPIIIYGDPLDICIVLSYPGGETCVSCLVGRGICIGPVILE
ncbi:MAG: hypothetical protein WAL85_08145 [Candidatus Korobacteraceae bacterium]